MKLKEVFEKSVQFFKDKKIETARLDAEILLSHVLKIERLQIYLKYDQPLTEIEITQCREAIKRRSQGEPVAYIVGEKGFYGENFYVGAGVLVPRPETELIVEEGLNFIIKNKIQNPQVIDLGAGTGCIGFSFLKNNLNAQLVSLEKSEKAFEYLKKNQTALELSERSQIHLTDVMQFNSEQKFDIVVANPPYIDILDASIQASVKTFEPHEALFSKSRGFEDIKNWARKSQEFLKINGALFFEIGHTQGAECLKIMSELNFYKEVIILKDLAGLDRVIKAIL